MSHPFAPPHRVDSGYSDSILNGYLNSSKTTLVSNENGYGNMSVRPIEIPQFVIDSEAGSNVPLKTPSKSVFSLYPDDSLSSPVSIASSSNTLYSSGNISGDEEINQLKDYEEKKPSSLRRLFNRKSSSSDSSGSHNAYSNDFNAKLNNFLMDKYYTPMELNFEEQFQFYLFNDLLANIFKPTTTHSFESLLFNYLMKNELDSGSEMFQFPKDFRPIHLTDDLIIQVLKITTSYLDSLAEIIRYYKENSGDANLLQGTNNEYFATLNKLATIHGFSIPLAQSIYGNWLLSFNNGSNINNYLNDEILSLFRRAARLSYITRILLQNKFFDKYIAQERESSMVGNEYFSAQELLSLKKFLKKDNELALGLAVFSIAESHHQKDQLNIAVNLWEINAHVSKELESCSMCIWGLTDGFGFGNKKHLHGKKKKYFVKRRIAQVYRTMISNGGQEDFGSSWVWKEKYD